MKKENQTQQKKQTNKLYNSAIRIKYKTIDEFYKKWFLYLKPYHKLTEKQIEVLVSFIEEYNVLKNKINDIKLLDQELYSLDVRKKIMAKHGLSPQNFKGISNSFKKLGILSEDNIFNKRIFPRLNDGDNNYKLLLLFDKEDESKQTL